MIQVLYWYVRFLIVGTKMEVECDPVADGPLVHVHFRLYTEKTIL